MPMRTYAILVIIFHNIILQLRHWNYPVSLFLCKMYKNITKTLLKNYAYIHKKWVKKFPKKIFFVILIVEIKFIKYNKEEIL